MIWACFAATEQLAVIELTKDSSVYQTTTESNVRVSAWQIKVGPNQVMQQDNDPKRSSKFTKE